MVDLTLNDIMNSWSIAQSATKDMDGFYVKFNELTGLDVDKVKQWWIDWNRLTHAEATTIAQKHKVNLRVGGFQAFVLDQLSQDETGKVPPKLKVVK